jgi:hypothetical protein
MKYISFHITSKEGNTLNKLANTNGDAIEEHIKNYFDYCSPFS